MRVQIVKDVIGLLKMKKSGSAGARDKNQNRLATTKTGIDYIVLAAKQAIELVNLGVTPNHARRNLDIFIKQYWQNKELKLHQTAQKKSMQCSKAALGIPFKKCKVEHSVPMSFITNKLMGMKNPTPIRVKRILKQWFMVVLVTPEEDDALREKGLRYKMPDGWDGRDVFARYKAAGIKFPKHPTTHSNSKS